MEDEKGEAPGEEEREDCGSASESAHGIECAAVPSGVRARSLRWPMQQERLRERRAMRAREKLLRAMRVREKGQAAGSKAVETPSADTKTEEKVSEKEQKNCAFKEQCKNMC